MPVQFTNNATATLASSITTGSTTLTLTTGQGAAFPSPAGSNFFYATLVDASNNIEIVKCTARASDSLTVTRAQEGTTAKAYPSGAKLELRPTAATLNNMAQLDAANTFSQVQTFSGGAAFGVAPTGVMPTGMIGQWPTNAAPAGWLLCNGQAVSRATYATLFALFSTTFGAGDGATTFNLPNFNDRMPIGVSAIAAAAGAAGGNKDATLVSHQHGVSAAGNTGIESNGHTHTVNDPGHQHNIQHDLNSNTSGAGLSGSGVATGGTWNTDNATTGIWLDGENTNHTHYVALSGTTDWQGASAANANLPPYIGIYFIIKT